MRIGERDLSVLLTEEGREVLAASAIGLPEASMVWLYVQDSDDMGLWARIAREDGDHLVLVRWEYVLTIDFPAGETRVVGLKG